MPISAIDVRNVIDKYLSKIKTEQIDENTLKSIYVQSISRAYKKAYFVSNKTLNTQDLRTLEKIKDLIFSEIQEEDEKEIRFTDFYNFFKNELYNNIIGSTLLVATGSVGSIGFTIDDYIRNIYYTAKALFFTLKKERPDIYSDTKEAVVIYNELLKRVKDNGLSKLSNVERLAYYYYKKILLLKKHEEQIRNGEPSYFSLMLGLAFNSLPFSQDVRNEFFDMNPAIARLSNDAVNFLQRQILIEEIKKRKEAEAEAGIEVNITEEQILNELSDSLKNQLQEEETQEGQGAIAQSEADKQAEETQEEEAKKEQVSEEVDKAVFNFDIAGDDVSIEETQFEESLERVFEQPNIRQASADVRMHLSMLPMIKVKKTTLGEEGNEVVIFEISEKQEPNSISPLYYEEPVVSSVLRKALEPLKYEKDWKNKFLEKLFNGEYGRNTNILLAFAVRYLSYDFSVQNNQGEEDEETREKNSIDKKQAWVLFGNYDIDRKYRVILKPNVIALQPNDMLSNIGEPITYKRKNKIIASVLSEFLSTQNYNNTAIALKYDSEETEETNVDKYIKDEDSNETNVFGIVKEGSKLMTDNLALSIDKSTEKLMGLLKDRVIYYLSKVQEREAGKSSDLFLLTREEVLFEATYRGIRSLMGYKDIGINTPIRNIGDIIALGEGERFFNDFRQYILQNTVYGDIVRQLTDKLKEGQTLHPFAYFLIFSELDLKLEDVFIQREYYLDYSKNNSLSFVFRDDTNKFSFVADAQYFLTNVEWDNLFSIYINNNDAEIELASEIKARAGDLVKNMMAIYAFQRIASSSPTAFTLNDDYFAKVKSSYITRTGIVSSGASLLPYTLFRYDKVSTNNETNIFGRFNLYNNNIALKLDSLETVDLDNKIITEFFSEEELSRIEKEVKGYNISSINSDPYTNNRILGESFLIAEYLGLEAEQEYSNKTSLGTSFSNYNLNISLLENKEALLGREVSKIMPTKLEGSTIRAIESPSFEPNNFSDINQVEKIVLYFNLLLNGQVIAHTPSNKRLNFILQGLEKYDFPELLNSINQSYLIKIAKTLNIPTQENIDIKEAINQKYKEISQTFSNISDVKSIKENLFKEYGLEENIHYEFKLENNNQYSIVLPLRSDSFAELARSIEQNKEKEGEQANSLAELIDAYRQVLQNFLSAYIQGLDTMLAIKNKGKGKVKDDTIEKIQKLKKSLEHIRDNLSDRVILLDMKYGLGELFYVGGHLFDAKSKVINSQTELSKRIIGRQTAHTIAGENYNRTLNNIVLQSRTAEEAHLYHTPSEVIYEELISRNKEEKRLIKGKELSDGMMYINPFFALLTNISHNFITDGISKTTITGLTKQLTDIFHKVASINLHAELGAYDIEGNINKLLNLSLDNRTKRKLKAIRIAKYEELKNRYGIVEGENEGIKKANRYNFIRELIEFEARQEDYKLLLQEYLFFYKAVENPEVVRYRVKLADGSPIELGKSIDVKEKIVNENNESIDKYIVTPLSETEVKEVTDYIKALQEYLYGLWADTTITYKEKTYNSMYKSDMRELEQELILGWDNLSNNERGYLTINGDNEHIPLDMLFFFSVNTKMIHTITEESGSKKYTPYKADRKNSKGIMEMISHYSPTSFGQVTNISELAREDKTSLVPIPTQANYIVSNKQNFDKLNRLIEVRQEKFREKFIIERGENVSKEASENANEGISIEEIENKEAEKKAFLLEKVRGSYLSQGDGLRALYTQESDLNELEGFYKSFEATVKASKQISIPRIVGARKAIGDAMGLGLMIFEDITTGEIYNIHDLLELGIIKPNKRKDNEIPSLIDMYYQERNSKIGKEKEWVNIKKFIGYDRENNYAKQYFNILDGNYVIDREYSNRIVARHLYNNHIRLKENNRLPNNEDMKEAIDTIRNMLENRHNKEKYEEYKRKFDEKFYISGAEVIISNDFYGHLKGAKPYSVLHHVTKEGLRKERQFQERMIEKLNQVRDELANDLLNPNLSKDEEIKKSVNKSIQKVDNKINTIQKRIKKIDKLLSDNKYERNPILGKSLVTMRIPSTSKASLRHSRVVGVVNRMGNVMFLPFETMVLEGSDNDGDMSTVLYTLPYDEPIITTSNEYVEQMLSTMRSVDYYVESLVPVDNSEIIKYSKQYEEKVSSRFKELKALSKTHNIPFEVINGISKVLSQIQNQDSTKLVGYFVKMNEVYHFLQYFHETYNIEFQLPKIKWGGNEYKKVDFLDNLLVNKEGSEEKRYDYLKYLLNSTKRKLDKFTNTALDDTKYNATGKANINYFTTNLINALMLYAPFSIEEILDWIGSDRLRMLSMLVNTSRFGTINAYIGIKSIVDKYYDDVVNAIAEIEKSIGEQKKKKGEQKQEKGGKRQEINMDNFLKAVRELSRLIYMDTNSRKEYEDGMLLKLQTNLDGLKKELAELKNKVIEEEELIDKLLTVANNSLKLQNILNVNRYKSSMDSFLSTVTSPIVLVEDNLSYEDVFYGKAINRLVEFGREVENRLKEKEADEKFEIEYDSRDIFALFLHRDIGKIQAVENSRLLIEALKDDYPFLRREALQVFDMLIKISERKSISADITSLAFKAYVNSYYSMASIGYVLHSKDENMIRDLKEKYGTGTAEAQKDKDKILIRLHSLDSVKSLREKENIEDVGDISATFWNVSRASGSYYTQGFTIDEIFDKLLEYERDKSLLLKPHERYNYMQFLAHMLVYVSSRDRAMGMVMRGIRVNYDAINSLMLERKMGLANTTEAEQLFMYNGFEELDSGLKEVLLRYALLSGDFHSYRSLMKLLPSSAKQGYTTYLDIIKQKARNNEPYIVQGLDNDGNVVYGNNVYPIASYMLSNNNRISNLFDLYLAKPTLSGLWTKTTTGKAYKIRDKDDMGEMRDYYYALNKFYRMNDYLLPSLYFEKIKEYDEVGNKQITYELTTIDGSNKELSKKLSIEIDSQLNAKLIANANLKITDILGDIKLEASEWVREPSDELVLTNIANSFFKSVQERLEKIGIEVEYLHKPEENWKGRIIGGKVQFNTAKIGLDTAWHELAHVYVAFLKTHSKNEYEHLKELVKDTPLFQKTKAKYNNIYTIKDDEGNIILNVDDEFIYDETIAELLGLWISKKRLEYRRNTGGLYGRITKFLDKIISKIIRLVDEYIGISGGEEQKKKILEVLERHAKNVLSGKIKLKGESGEEVTGEIIADDSVKKELQRIVLYKMGSTALTDTMSAFGYTANDINSDSLSYFSKDVKILTNDFTRQTSAVINGKLINTNEKLFNTSFGKLSYQDFIDNLSLAKTDDTALQKAKEIFKSMQEQEIQDILNLYNNLILNKSNIQRELAYHTIIKQSYESGKRSVDIKIDNITKTIDLDYKVYTQSLYVLKILKLIPDYHDGMKLYWVKKNGSDEYSKLFDEYGILHEYSNMLVVEQMINGEKHIRIYNFANKGYNWKKAYHESGSYLKKIWRIAERFSKSLETEDFSLLDTLSYETLIAGKIITGKKIGKISQLGLVKSLGNSDSALLPKLVLPNEYNDRLRILLNVEYNNTKIFQYNLLKRLLEDSYKKDDQTDLVGDYLDFLYGLYSNYLPLQSADVKNELDTYYKTKNATALIYAMEKRMRELLPVVNTFLSADTKTAYINLYSNNRFLEYYYLAKSYFALKTNRSDAYNSIRDIDKLLSTITSDIENKNPYFQWVYATYDVAKKKLKKFYDEYIKKTSKIFDDFKKAQGKKFLTSYEGELYENLFKYEEVNINGKKERFNTFRLLNSADPEYKRLSKQERDFIEAYADLLEQLYENAFIAKFGVLEGVKRFRAIKANVRYYVPPMFKTNELGVLSDEAKETAVNSLENILGKNLSYTEKEYSDLPLLLYNMVDEFGSTKVRDSLIGMANGGYNIEDNQKISTDLRSILNFFSINQLRYTILQETLDNYNIAKNLMRLREIETGEKQENNINLLEYFGKKVLFNERLVFSNTPISNALEKAGLFMESISSLVILGFNFKSNLKALLTSVNKVISSSFAGRKNIFKGSDFAKAVGLLANHENMTKAYLLAEEFGLLNTAQIEWAVSKRLGTTDRRIGNVRLDNSFPFVLDRMNDVFIKLATLTAQMLHENTWEAYSVKREGDMLSLVYDEKKDKRDKLIKEYILEKRIQEGLETGKILTGAYDSSNMRRLELILNRVGAGLTEGSEVFLLTKPMGRMLTKFRVFNLPFVNNVLKAKGKNFNYKELVVTHKNGKKEVVEIAPYEEAIIKTLLRSLSTLLVTRDIKAFTNTLSEEQKRSLQGAFINLVYSLSIILLNSFLWDDEKKDKDLQERKNFLYQLLREIARDMNMFAVLSPTGVLNVDGIISISVMRNLAEATWLWLTWDFDNATRKTINSIGVLNTIETMYRAIEGKGYYDLNKELKKYMQEKERKLKQTFGIETE